jgi:hypothetical protein
MAAAILPVIWLGGSGGQLSFGVRPVKRRGAFTMKSIAGWFVAFSLLGCGVQTDVRPSKSGQPAIGSATVVVTDELDGSQVALSEKQSKWFVKDISVPGRRSMISKYPAAPLATFEYGGKKYLMHGNAVIHVAEDGTELLWTGPYLQALISAGFRIHQSIDAVEKLPNLNGVTMDAPGAFPGGGPAPLVDEK